MRDIPIQQAATNCIPRITKCQFGGVSWVEMAFHVVVTDRQFISAKKDMLLFDPRQLLENRILMKATSGKAPV